MSGRVPQVWFGSDYDGDLCMISRPEETDNEEWVVEVEAGDGDFRVVRRLDYFFSYSPPLERGEGCWRVGRDGGVRVWLPGGAEPVTVREASQTPSPVLLARPPDNFADMTREQKLAWVEEFRRGVLGDA